MGSINDIGMKAKKASRKLALLSTLEKNNILQKAADILEKNAGYIIEQNKIDIKNAEDAGMKTTLIDRLSLNESRIKGMAQGMRDVAKLDDPVGSVDSMWKRPNGLQIGQKRVPLGVIGIIYEARPNVTSDAASLCIKSGNSVILRGGKEAINSNKAVVKMIKEALRESGIDENSVQLVEDTSRESANEMMRLDKYIDVLIPRGGAGLIQAVKKNSTVPVIETGVGNCHIYVDKDADFDMACDIVINAKCSRPSVCNAAESLLIHKDIADKFVPMICSKLRDNNVEIRGCSKVQSLFNDVVPADEEDWGKEYLDYIMSVKVIDSIEEAIDHIDKYSTNHSEAIVTNNYNNAQKFLNEVDSAAVYVNASTRFTDGGEMGFGAEIGISTQKLHARGPMGLKQLTTIKYIVYGDGQIRK